MSMNKRTILILALILTPILALVLTVVLFMVNASVSESSTQVAEPPAYTQELVVPTHIAEPELHILRFGVSGFDGRWNPVLASDSNDLHITSLIFEPLIISDHDGSPIPNLADWVVSNNNMKYTFVLKDGITFSDGEPMTSRDVAFTYTLMCHPEYNGPRSYAVSKLQGYDEFKTGKARNVTGIEIINERTIAFHLFDGEANAANIWNFAYGILPEHIYAFDTWNEFNAKTGNPVGSGKFVFDNYIPGESLCLKRNDNYWNSNEFTQLDGISFAIIPEESLFQAFKLNHIDLAQPAATMKNYTDFNELDSVEVRAVFRNSYQFLAFNTLRMQLNDPQVRRALLYALDRQAYIDITLGKLGSIGMAPVSPASWAFPRSGLNTYDYNLDKARELMSDAGWEPEQDGILAQNGIRMELRWLVYPEAHWPKILASLAQDSWRQIGVDLTITEMGFDEINAITFNAKPGDIDFDVFAMAFMFSIDPDPTGSMFDYDEFLNGGFSISGYYNERAQELIIAGRNETNQATRTKIYNEWARIMNENLPTAIIAHRYNLWVISNRVEGLNIGPYHDWWRNISEVTVSEVTVN